MDFKRDGMAAIYYQDDKDDCLLLKCVALVEYSVLTRSFTIISGDYIGCTNKDFNRVVGDEEFIFKDKCNLKFRNNKKELSVYIISNSFIADAFDSDIRCTPLDLYFEITQKLSGNVLYKKKNKILTRFSYPQYLSNINNGVFSKDNVDKMLDIPTEEEEAKVEQAELDNILSSLNLPPGFQMVVSYVDEEGKEINQNENVNGEVKVTDDKVSSFSDIDVNQIIKDINAKIIGQENAVKTLVTNIYYNQILIDSLNKNEEVDLSELDSRKVSILLDGSTGTGKTAILKEIASKLDLPIDIVNANSFSETGYVGPTITDILARLLKQAKGNLELAERGIIVLDEIDKIASPIEYDGKDMKKGVQEELLSFIGGGKYDLVTASGFIKTTTTFDTSKITFILSGAFTKLRDNKIKETEKKINGIGFNTDYSNKKNEYEITSQDYVDYGLMREFFGRIKVLTSTRSYSIEDLKKILLESKISPLRNLEKTVQMFGYDNLDYNEEFLNKICEEAYKLDTGARGLQSIMSGIQNKLLINLINKAYSENEPIKINTDILSEYKKDNIRTYTRKKTK